MNALAESWRSDHGIQYVPVLSEPQAEDQWSGRTGFVHQAVMEDIGDLSGYQVYACGAPLMVEAAHRDFTTKCGLPDDEFYSDAFTPASRVSAS
jgi:CDP-4-dehydro-6-deoxyglucose reductase